jgi:hypothetical protein
MTGAVAGIDTNINVDINPASTPGRAREFDIGPPDV